MSYISIDPKTYRRLEQFAQRAGVSIHAAASDAVENWLDITADPRLAITALTTIALRPALDHGQQHHHLVACLDPMLQVRRHVHEAAFARLLFLSAQFQQRAS